MFGSNPPAGAAGSTFGLGNKFGFGSTTTTSAPAFGFGSTTTTSAPPAFGFGSTATTSAPTAFGFGSTTTTSAPTAFGFGSTATTSAPTAFGFGASLTGVKPGGFGGFGASATTTTAPTLFGGFGAKPATTSAPSFGFGFSNAANTSTTSTNLFGKPSVAFGQPAASTTNLFGQQTQGIAQAPAAQPQLSETQLVHAAIHLPSVFNDERDTVIMKWNQLQAFWGTGKGFVNQETSVDFKPDNPYCYFKAVGYSSMPSSKDEDGFVALITNKTKDDLEANQQASVNFLSNLFGNQPTLSVCVESLKELPENKTEMVIYLQERLPNGTTKRVFSSTLHKFMSQENISKQLTAAGVLQVVPKASLSAENLKFYLSQPPAGLDSILWEQAKKDNPDPAQFLPVPMVGFTELHSRLKHQEQQSKMHQSRLEIIQDEISTLQQNHANTLSRIADYKRKHLELSHRVLRVIVKQETHRKMGYGILAEEEQLRVKLETTQQELNAPTQFKSRLNELLSQIRLQNQVSSGYATESCADLIDETLLNEVRAHLKQQQEGLKHLIGIIKDDVEDLKLIEDGYLETPGR